jgi:hypothetical protein
MHVFRNSGVRSGLAAALLLVAGSGLASDHLIIVSEGGTGKDWKPAPDLAPASPAYPGVVADKSDQVCVSVGYLLNKDGSTSDFTLLKSWSAKHPAGAELDTYVDPFARNALAAVQRWRFVPVREGSTPRAAYTSASFAFSTDPAADQSALRGHCGIDNLKAFIAKKQADAYQRGNLKKGEIDRDRVNNPPDLYKAGSN